MMKNFFIVLFIFKYLVLNTAISQQIIPERRHMPFADSIAFIKLPGLTLPELYKGSKAPLLPSGLDNSQLPYFRPVFTQEGWSCGQAASIGYNFTYELNRLRDLPADTSVNQYPTHFAYNFFNEGIYDIGIGYLYTFDLLKGMGTPNVEIYGGMCNGHLHWMPGYDNYHHAMQNRLSDIYAISTADEEGILTVKHWLNDHLDGSPHGGLANFYTDLYTYNHLMPGTPEEGKCVVTAFGPYSGHAMTIVGWNDSIRWDYNNDGQYTNNIDINGDGTVDVKDWEIGGFKFANSYGIWADSGFCYVMYKVFAEEKLDGGVWNKSVHVIDVNENFSPSATYKIALKHISRESLKITAGVTTDTSDQVPMFTMDFPVFDYQGGNHYLTGVDSLEANKYLEFGLDITPLLSHVVPGMPAKFFLIIHENDPFGLYAGSLEYFALRDYMAGGIELQGSPTAISLLSNGLTVSSVIHTFNFNKVNISTSELPPVISGQPYTVQLSASGGSQPYTWEIASTYVSNQYSEEYPDIQGEKLNISDPHNGFASKAIDFIFPFYGRNLDTLVVYVDGFIMPSVVSFPYPYQVNDIALFRYFPMMAAFFNNHLSITNLNEGIWYEGNEYFAAFRWKVKLLTGAEPIPIDFTTILYPTGRIEYYIQEFQDIEAITRIIGVSAGNGSNYQLAGFSNTMPFESSTAIMFDPLNLPGELSIDDSGMLSLQPLNDDLIYEIPVKVTDANHISSVKSFRLSDGIIFEYTIMSGGNNRIEYGENPLLNFTVKNIGIQTLSNVVLNIQINDPYITILDGTQSIGGLPPGLSVYLPGAVSLSVSNNVPDNYNFIVTVVFSTDNGQWLGKMNLIAFAPVIKFRNFEVLDENGRLDPGENSNLEISVINSGHASAYNVEAEISTSDDYITFNGTNNLFFGEIAAGATGIDTLNVTVSGNAPNGHYAPFDYAISAPPVFLTEGTFNVLIGRFPLLLADLDPDQLTLPVLTPLLDELFVNYDTEDYLPEDLDNYQNIFVFTGKKFVNHVLTEPEGQRLAEFLDSGGNVYLEGGVTWYPDPPTPVHAMFSLQTQTVTWNYYSPVMGVPGTFTQNMEFDYSSGITLYNHYLIPVSPAFTILHGSNELHAFAVAANQGDYKTIGSNVNFFGLVDGEYPSTKKELLKGMLNFFGIEFLITSDSGNPLEFQPLGLTLFPNPVKDKAIIKFYLPTEGTVSVSLHNIEHSFKMSILTDVLLNAGFHEYQIQTHSLKPGIYICELNIRGNTNHVKVVKLK